LAGVGCDDPHIVTSEDAPLDLAACRGDRNVRALDIQLAALGHRVASIYNEVEDGGLELNWIDPAIPQVRCADEGDFDCFARCPPQKALRDRQ